MGLYESVVSAEKFPVVSHNNIANVRRAGGFDAERVRKESPTYLKEKIR